MTQDEKYMKAASDVSEIFAKNNFDLLFGAGHYSMMGECYKTFVKYKRRNNGISIDINLASVKMNGENIIKETLLVLTVLPMLSKSIQYIKMKNRAKILAIKALNISEV